MADDYPEIAARFARDTAQHRMTVLHDDGLYRHLLFAEPTHGFYWFELVTWPGKLAIAGDIGNGYTFTQTDDMFAFFRGNSWKGSINPQYWAEKVIAGREVVEQYDQDSFERQVKEQVADAIRSGDAPRGIGAEVTRDIFEWGDITHEAGARQELEKFSYEGWRFKDTWEWDFTDYSWHYLWACHAIVWGIARYDRVRSYGLQQLAASAPKTVTA